MPCVAGPGWREGFSWECASPCRVSTSSGRDSNVCCAVPLAASWVTGTCGANIRGWDATLAEGAATPPASNRGYAPAIEIGSRRSSATDIHARTTSARSRQPQHRRVTPCSGFNDEVFELEDDRRGSRFRQSWEVDAFVVGPRRRVRPPLPGLARVASREAKRPENTKIVRDADIDAALLESNLEVHQGGDGRCRYLTSRVRCIWNRGIGAGGHGSSS